MRLFLAAELPPEVREMAQDTAVALAQRLDQRTRARWVAIEHMHLTVRFIGHVPDDSVHAVMDALKPPLSVAPFEVEFRDCGVFPRSGPPRVIWIGLSQGREELGAMHEEFNRRLAPLGYEAEARPFSAHLTLARIKEIGSRAARELRGSIRDVRLPIMRCRLDAATLFMSQLSPGGSRYTRLLHIPLTPER